ncbi:glycosyl transferase [Agaricicola taiwanensis]|uniref:Glycosyl transferase n=1 Tax=Agaricicola taiwanensis TaxID=591372 RepID=A0A8J2YJ29_9RHOB|nr:glycosyltransferase [Agaricicola taiwanensis]GGE46064.1 glycosyl transferase [Agaricicola taiwanensis]
MPPRSILHVLRAPRGGVLRHVDDLARAQTSLGHRVGLVCDLDTGNQRDSERLDALAKDLTLGVTRISMDRRVGLGDLKAMIEVARVLRRIKPDVVHGHGAKGGVYARLGASLADRRGRRVKRFYTAHGGSLHYDPSSLAGRFYFTVERLLERATDGIVFVSRFEEDTYNNKVGMPRCAVRQVYNGLHQDDFIPCDLSVTAADVLFLGELRQLKGVDVLIDALAVLNKERVVTAAIVGGGPDRDAFVERIATRGLEDRITVHAPMPALDAFRLGRIMAVPSRAEALPYVVLEAVAAAKPVVASKVGGIPEILPENNLVLPSDVNALAAALGSKIDGGASTLAAAKDLSDAIRDRFSVAAMATGITSFYDEARTHGFDT